MKKAFTILELLVVMAVIGVLITLAVVGIQALQKAQRETVKLNDLRNLQGKIEEYYGKYRMYPNFSHMVVATDGSAICLLNPNATDARNTAAKGRCNQNTTLNAEFFSSTPISIKFNSSIDDLLGYVQWFIELSYSYITTHYDWGCNGTWVGGNNQVNQDIWVLFYSVPETQAYDVGAPQQYRIGGCTENGPINPIGSRLD